MKLLLQIFAVICVAGLILLNAMVILNRQPKPKSDHDYLTDMALAGAQLEARGYSNFVVEPNMVSAMHGGWTTTRYRFLGDKP